MPIIYSNMPLGLSGPTIYEPVGSGCDPTHMEQSRQGRKDPNETAFNIVQQALGMAPKIVPHEKSHAAENRGHARAEKLTPKHRYEIARLTAKKRWAHGS